MNSASLPNLSTETFVPPFEVDEHVAPRTEDLPEGSAQVTFTIIPEGDVYKIFTHTAGIYDAESFYSFLDIAAEYGQEPVFPTE